jgi:hypothetical protein
MAIAAATSVWRRRNTKARGSAACTGVPAHRSQPPAVVAVSALAAAESVRIVVHAVKLGAIDVAVSR